MNTLGERSGSVADAGPQPAFNLPMRKKAMNIRQAKKIYNRMESREHSTPCEAELRACGKLLSVSVRKLGRLRGFWFFMGKGSVGVSGLRWKR